MKSWLLRCICSDYIFFEIAWPCGLSICRRSPGTCFDSRTGQTKYVILKFNTLAWHLALNDIGQNYRCVRDTNFAQTSQLDWKGNFHLVSLAILPRPISWCRFISISALTNPISYRFIRDIFQLGGTQLPDGEGVVIIMRTLRSVSGRTSLLCFASMTEWMHRHTTENPSSSSSQSL